MQLDNSQLEALLIALLVQLALSHLLELRVAPLAQPAVPLVPVIHHVLHVMQASVFRMDLALSVPPTNFLQEALLLALPVPLVSTLVLVLQAVMIAPQAAKSAPTPLNAKLVSRAMA